MLLPTLEGVIRRRMLVNFRVDPDAIRKTLPSRLRPKLDRGSAIAGICLIRLEELRPSGFPSWLGFASENAAHRVAVEWDEDGIVRDGVYIPRRDSSSAWNRLVGGRLFPGEHQPARFDVEDDANGIMLRMTSRDGLASVYVRGRAAQALPSSSKFGSLEEVSRFFERGSIGFSERRDGRSLDGLELATSAWKVSPLEIDEVESSFFSDRNRFPSGTVEFDCALLMRDIPHRWNGVRPLPRDGEGSSVEGGGRDARGRSQV